MKTDYTNNKVCATNKRSINELKFNENKIKLPIISGHLNLGCYKFIRLLVDCGRTSNKINYEKHKNMRAKQVTIVLLFSKQCQNPFRRTYDNRAERRKRRKKNQSIPITL